uniref:RcpC/CpaB family pilus assembly protein n=1 Tax=Streptomyces sp. YIM 98790 TaxID=2689077 RepID=UPI001FB5D5FC
PAAGGAPPPPGRPGQRRSSPSASPSSSSPPSSPSSSPSSSQPGPAGPGRPAPGEGTPGGLVAAPVRIADPGVARLLSPGDRVDVLATRPPLPGEDPAPAARRVAHRVEVAEVPGDVETGAPGDAGRGALVVLAVPPATAAELAAAAADSRLAVTRW